MSEARIGNYEVRRVLGEGACCEVLLARDPASGEEVAIKRLHPAVLRDRERGRLHRLQLLNEATLAGKLAHPGIVQIRDAVLADDEAFVVMEYAAGGTLAAHCRPDALLPFDRLVRILYNCTQALDFACRQGVIHRDIKPANILLAEPAGDEVKISDFGAAVRTASESTQISGLGSPAYMSPQQVREMPLDQRADIYALGVVMYQLLTARLPFEADNNYSLLWRIVHEEPQPPSALRPEVPEALDAIVRRAMEKELDRRYQSWAEFAHDLALASRNRLLVGGGERLPEAEQFRALRALAFFRGFDEPALWEAVRLTRWSRAEAGTVVMREGEAGNHVCILVEGEARVTKRGRLLQVLTAGDCFGEVALFAAGGGVRSTSVTAATGLALASIAGAALAQASDACRMRFYEAFLEVLATRLSLADARLANL